MTKRKVTYMEDHPNSHYIEHFGRNHEVALSLGLQKLINEHKPLLAEAEKLIAAVLSTKGDMDKWKEMENHSLAFVTNLERHSLKEENTVFQFLKKYLETTSGPIELMEKEHQEINAYLDSFMNMTHSLHVAPSDASPSKLIFLLEQAFELMQQHFYKEEHAIYPMAEQLLSDEEKDLIAYQY